MSEDYVKLVIHLLRIDELTQETFMSQTTT